MLGWPSGFAAGPLFIHLLNDCPFLHREGHFSTTALFTETNRSVRAYGLAGPVRYTGTGTSGVTWLQHSEFNCADRVQGPDPNRPCPLWLLSIPPGRLRVRPVARSRLGEERDLAHSAAALKKSPASLLKRGQ